MLFCQLYFKDKVFKGIDHLKFNKIYSKDNWFCSEQIYNNYGGFWDLMIPFVQILQFDSINAMLFSMLSIFINEDYKDLKHSLRVALAQSPLFYLKKTD